MARMHDEPTFEGGAIIMHRSWLRGILASPILVMLFTATLCAQSSFVYTNDDVDGSNTVSGFSVGSNGSLTPLPGSPFPTGGMGSGGRGFVAANRTTVCAAMNFLYVSNTGSGDVSGFTINPSTGSLTPIPGSPFRTGGSGVDAVACTPNGKFLMVSDSGSGDIAVLGIADTGALSPIPGLRFALGDIPDGIKISPDGNFLAVALPLSNRMGIFSIGPNGALTPSSGSPFSGGGGGKLAGVDINCASDLLFGVEANSGNTIVDVFGIATNGALTSIPDSPFLADVGDNSNVTLLSPDDQLLFVSNQASSSVTAFTVASNGRVTLVPGSPFAAPDSLAPNGMVTDPTGSFLYVADPSNHIYAYSVASGGALTPVPGSPFPANPTGSLLSVAAFPAKTCRKPPTCSTAVASPSLLWSPDHTMTPIAITGVTASQGEAVTITIVAVHQDEPVQSSGSGNFAPDAMLAPLTVRAERDGGADGRVYHIDFMATDSAGVSCEGAVTVCVPHDQGQATCVDEGPVYDSTATQ